MNPGVILIDDTFTATLTSLSRLVNSWMIDYTTFMDVPCLAWQNANPNELVYNCMLLFYSIDREFVLAGGF